MWCARGRCRLVVGPGDWVGGDDVGRVDFAKVILCAWPERLLRLPLLVWLQDGC